VDKPSSEKRSPHPGEDQPKTKNTVQTPSSKHTSQNSFEDFFGLGLELISLLFFARLLVDTSNRMLVPFIPQFSSGLGLTLAAYSWMLALRSLSGVVSPFIGMLADRYGRRIVITSALALRGLGLSIMAGSTGWWSLMPLLLIGLTTSAYLPVQKAYVSDQVCYERRGRALATVEASFSVSGILGLPLVGWLIDTWGWRMPFLVMGLLSFVAALTIGLRLPSTQKRTPSGSSWEKVRTLFRRPAVLVSMAVALILCAAFGIFMTFWGIWLTEDFGFRAIDLGLIGTLIGFAELAGVVFSGLFIDAIGKRRGSLIGLFAAALSFMLIPLAQQDLIWIRVMLVGTAVLLEFCFTSLFPLFAEQAPEARATLFSLVALGTSLGIGLGSPAATTLWQWKGLASVTFVGGGALLLAFVLSWFFLKDEAARQGS
jgi:predicted MFS family arabinose efflux permease